MNYTITKGGARLISAEDAQGIRERLDRFEQWRGDRTSYHPDEVPEDVPTVSNDERSALEVFNTLTDPPAQLFAYVQRINNAQSPSAGETERGCILKTWTGDTLGRIIDAGRPWRSNFGDERQAITVRLADEAGTLYHGTFYSSAGDYARLGKAKAQD